VGGPASRIVEATSAQQIIDVIREVDAARERLLILGGGSNVVIGDAGFAGTVLLIRSRGMEVTVDGCAGAWLAASAGEPWDDVVAHAVEQEWSGLEALSGIPGLVGATPIQNVGAYGTDIADVLARVTAYDRVSGQTVTLPVGECGLGYRDSIFKRDPNRYVVLTVTLQLPLGSMSAPVRYAELANALGIDLGQRAPAAQVREAVLALRRSKGMVLDPADHDTWSVGSFFTNPVVTGELAERLPSEAPRWGQADGHVKLSAAWLVQNAGFDRGFTLDGRASLSTKHTLAITNRGDANAADVWHLASTIRDGVQRQFGIDLVPEPTVIA